MYWNSDDWKVDDKAWMAQRKKEWKYVQHNLKYIMSSKFDGGSYVKAHKELFFKGLYDEEKYGEYGNNAFGFALPLFVLWYHPELQEDDIQTLIDFHCTGYMRAKMISRCRDIISTYNRSVESECIDSYGLFGGKEERIVSVLWGEPHIGAKFDNISEFESQGAKTDKVFLENTPLFDLYWAGVGAVMRNGNKLRNSCGQYMYDHAMTPNILDKLVEDSNFTTVKRVARNALYFNESPNTDKGNKVSEAMRDHLLSMYRSGVFPEKVQKIWKEVEDAPPCFDKR